MIKALACDECGSQDDVTRWRIAPTGGKPVVRDLCAEHAKPLVHLMSGSGEDGTRADFQMTTLEELKAKKASAPRRAPKTPGP